MILYPIYKDGAESGGNSGGNPNDTPVTDSGCGGVISGLGCAVLVSAVAVVAVIKKKGE